MRLLPIIILLVGLPGGCRSAQSASERVSREQSARSEIAVSAADTLSRVSVRELLADLVLEEPQIEIRADSSGRRVTVKARRAEMSGRAAAVDSVEEQSSREVAATVRDTATVTAVRAERSSVESPSLPRAAVVLGVIALLWLLARARRSR